MGEGCTWLCKEELALQSLKRETCDLHVDPLPPPNPHLSHLSSSIIFLLEKMFPFPTRPPTFTRGLPIPKKFFSCSYRPAWKGFRTGGKEFNGHFLPRPPPSSKSTIKQGAATVWQIQHLVPVCLTLCQRPFPLNTWKTRGLRKQAQDAGISRMPSQGPWSQIWPTEWSRRNGT